MAHPFLDPAIWAAVAIVAPPATDGTPGPTTTDLLAQIQQLTTTVGALQTALNGKASASSVSTLSQRVTTLGQTVDTKAATTYVDQQVHAIGDVDADQASAIAAIKQTLTGEGADLKTLFANQASQKLLLDGLRTDVDAKAPSATVATLSGRVTTVANTVNDASTGLATRAAASDLAALTTTVAGKADATALAAVKATADNALPLAGGTMKAGAVVTGLGVPKATAMDKAVQKSELTGGLQQPYRFFLDVQASPVTAFVRTNERVDIADDNGTGQVLALTAFVITNTGTAAVASTVTLLAKSVATNTTLYTLSVPVLLASAPAVGKALDLLSLLSAPPADIPLTEPIYFTVAATAGKFNVRVEGKKR